jgi:phosphoribosyl-AMP cyclohydrolase
VDGEQAHLRVAVDLPGAAGEARMIGRSGLFAGRDRGAGEIEEGIAFAPKFDGAGLITCVITEARSKDLLMVAHMNEEALERTLTTGEAWFFSRSRQKLWKKGETSGHVLRLVEMRVDCDQDVLWLAVEAAGAGVCHTGRRSCFYRAVVQSAPGAPPTLQFRDAERTFDPAAVYGAAKERS